MPSAMESLPVMMTIVNAVPFTVLDLDARALFYVSTNVRASVWASIKWATSISWLNPGRTPDIWLAPNVHFGDWRLHEK